MVRAHDAGLGALSSWWFPLFEDRFAFPPVRGFDMIECMVCIS